MDKYQQNLSKEILTRLAIFNATASSLIFIGSRGSMKTKSEKLVLNVLNPSA